MSFSKEFFIALKSPMVEVAAYGKICFFAFTHLGAVWYALGDEDTRM